MKTFIAVAVLLALPATRAGAVPPPLPENPKLEFHPRKPVRFALDNGLKVFFLEDHSLPIVHVGAIVKAGGRFDPPGKTGTADLMASAQDAAGTTKYSPEEMDREREYLAIDLDASMDLDRGGVSMTCLSKHLDKGLDLFAETLRRPAFRGDKVEIERQKMLEAIRRRNDEPMDAARREARRLYFGPDHPYGRRAEVATVAAITRQDLADYHARYYVPNNVSLIVAGDLTRERLEAELSRAFGDWARGNPGLPAIPPAPTIDARVVYLFPKNVPQASIRMMQAGPLPNDPDEYALEVMNDILGGGGFATRLFGRVRSQQGLAYSVGTRIVQLADEGWMAAACGTKNETAVKASSEVLKNIDEMRSAPVGEEELKVAEDGIANRFVFRFTSAYQIAAEAASLDYYGYPADYLDTYLDKIRGVTREDVRRVARKWLRPDKLLMIAIGDPAHFDGSLSALGQVREKKLD